MKRTSKIFVLGMITAFLIQGALDAGGVDPLYEINLPWWTYAVSAIAVMVLAAMEAGRFTNPT
jgi:hypothetical protein